MSIQSDATLDLKEWNAEYRRRKKALLDSLPSEDRKRLEAQWKRDADREAAERKRDDKQLVVVQKKIAALVVQIKAVCREIGRLRRVERTNPVARREYALAHEKLNRLEHKETQLFRQACDLKNHHFVAKSKAALEKAEALLAKRGESA